MVVKGSVQLEHPQTHDEVFFSQHFGEDISYLIFNLAELHNISFFNIIFEEMMSHINVMGSFMLYTIFSIFIALVVTNEWDRI